MISVTELRAGATFEENGDPFAVIKYEHTKMGRGTANIRVRVKNLKTGSVVEKTYISGAKVTEIATLRRKMQYLYQNGQTYFFVDPKTFEQFEISANLIAAQAPFLCEQALVDVVIWEDQPLLVELPPKIQLTVIETDPGVKGNSAANIYKSAVLNNGLKIKVPLFVDANDKILVDTRTGEYVERVK